jgi:hypothetical protein
MEKPEEDKAASTRARKPKSNATIYRLVILALIIILVGVIIVSSGRSSAVENQTENAQIVFSEDFTGEDLTSLETQGWSIWYKPKMQEIGSQANFPQENVLATDNGTLKAEGAGGFMYSTNWSNCTISYKFYTGVSPGNFWSGMAFRTENSWTSGTVDSTSSGSWPQNTYILQLGYQGSTNRLLKIVNGTWTEITSLSQTIELNVWHDVVVEASGSSLKVYLDNQLLLSATDSSLTGGGIGLLNCSGPVYFDDVTVSQ